MILSASKAVSARLSGATAGALAKAQIGAEGIGCEPASAVTFAGLKKLVAQGKITREERVIIILTGHTLKDSEYTIKYHRGELLRADESEGATRAEHEEHAALMKPPLVLDADMDIVLRELETQMNAARVTQPA